MKNNSTHTKEVFSPLGGRGLSKRIEALVYLGKQIELKDEQLLAIQEFSKHSNSWFTLDNTNYALENISSLFLEKEKLNAFAEHYKLPEDSRPKPIGIIMNGNVPLVGFHDLLCVFLSGHHAKIKLAETDKYLIPHLVKIMTEGFPEVEGYFDFVERMPKVDAIIASGSQKSVKAFKTYFAKYPNIIRDNRFSIAVLDGNESKEELTNLGKDIFYYFGLSSHNVSKIYLPPNYDFVPLLEATHEYNQIVLTNKYKNNFDYNYTLHILNSIDYKANGCIMILEDEAVQSRIATLHYEVYEDEKHLEKLLLAKQTEIQNVISNKTFPNFKNKNFGHVNVVKLHDFENGMDVMAFLKESL